MLARGQLLLRDCGDTAVLSSCPVKPRHLAVLGRCFVAAKSKNFLFGLSSRVP